jgi:hypothetical protein
MDIYHYWHAAAVNVDAQRACNRGAYPVGMLLLQLLVAIVLGGLLTSMGK